MPRRLLTTIGVTQIVAAAAIAVGWAMRDEHWIVPDRGLGYALGITGLGAMVLLLGYPIRKRLPWLRGVGQMRRWFEIHMLLGLLGPLAILYHANFRAGSQNATVALFCMVVVAGSGVIGRFLYVRVHAGLEGRRRTLAELREEVAHIGHQIAKTPGRECVVSRLSRFELALLDRGAPLHVRWRRRLGARWSGYRTMCDVRRILRHTTRRGDPRARATRRAARRYVRSVCAVAGREIWERLFALWHVAHLPLSFLMYATSILHVVAVHLY